MKMTFNHVLMAAVIGIAAYYFTKEMKFKRRITN